MINKVIHYCWFGNKPLPKLAEKCIQSWKKNLPDFEIKRWDESNFDINIIPYTQQASKAKKWAFVSDFARFHILYHEGGVYLDCDVEVLKYFDNDLLNQPMFTGFETKNYVAPGLIMGSVKETDLFEKVLSIYSSRQFDRPGGFDETTVVTFFTNFLKEKGLVLNNNIQTVQGMTIYPSSYFSPLDTIKRKTNITPETYTIHHYAGSWISPITKFKMFLVKLSYQYKAIMLLRSIFQRFF
jgi:mannosyltransferase OCH1-like enzyme